MLILHNIEKAFDDQPVLRGVSLELRVGEVVVLLGPSGCGKTTLLRIVAGLERPDNGRLLLDDHDLTQFPVYRRGFGMVFQEYALFPHKNVFQNVAFGLRMLNWERPRIAERVHQALELVGLAGFGARPIHELSGGEQQRVALARSLAPAPRLLLLDEPLGALDRALRERLMLELRAILKRAGGVMGRPQGITAVYVTHDQAEAFAIADRVIVMNDGRIEQQGSPTQLYQRPATPFVARFLGMENLFDGEILSAEPLVVRTVLGDLTVAGEPGSRGAGEPGSRNTLSPCHPVTLSPGHPVTLLIRPEAGRLVTDEKAANRMHGRLRALSFRGRYQIATITISNLQSPISIKLEFDSAVSLPPVGSETTFALEPGSIVLLESG